MLTQGADKVLIAPVGAIMIHNVSANVNGDYHEMERTAEELQELNRAMAGAYAQKSWQTDGRDLGADGQGNMVIGRKSYQLWICRCDHRTTESRSNQCNRTEPDSGDDGTG